MMCCRRRPQVGRLLTGSLFAFAAVIGWSSSELARAGGVAPDSVAVTDVMDQPPPQVVAVAAPTWTSANPTIPRAISQPDPYVAPAKVSPSAAYAPKVNNASANGVAGFAKPQAVPAARVAPLLVTPVQQARDLRVMTFNLRVRTIFDGLNIWDMRRETVVQRVREFDPDLFGTQEGLDVQEDFLRANLPDYTFFGVGRDNGKRSGEMCGIFFRTSRFEMLDGGNFWLSNRPDKPGSHGWGALFPRMVTWVKLRPRDGSAPAFCWFNTHFDAWNSHARSESARMMLAWMDIIAGKMPRVVTGDFNATPGSDPYQTLVYGRRTTPEKALSDAFRVANPNPVHDEGTMHNFSGRRDGNRIDWILATPQFQVISAAIDHARGPVGYPSDHFPVTVTLRAVPAMAAAPARVPAAAPAAAPAQTPVAQAPVARIE
jgi:endonuclease/exonuclease/phosphatase family metal-dependent hydrolase